MQEKSKEAIQRYLDTLKTMDPDKVLLERIEKTERELKNKY